LQKKKLNGSAIVGDKQLLQRAWDVLAIWKETYPEGWDADDEQLLDDLLTRIAEQRREWQGLTMEELDELVEAHGNNEFTLGMVGHVFAIDVEAKLKEKNA
jgi:hypothetical protein